MTTLTLSKAIELVPSVGATSPSQNVSSDYAFVSTRDVLEKVIDMGWNITNVTGQNKRPHSQHRVTLVHNNFLDKVTKQDETIPRIELFNSHDRTKRFMFAVGLFRLVCSNGLIVAAGACETIRSKHRSCHIMDTKSIADQLSLTVEKFPTVLNVVEGFKQRELSYEEQQDLAQFALKGRYLYRSSMPKRFADINETATKFLQVNRGEDEGNDTWKVYNRLQENFIRGIQGFSRAVTGYADSIRVNELLWKGAEQTLKFEGPALRKELNSLLNKNN